ncbi:chemotaxis phosphatase [Candidatus Photodesmus katoptron]|uniref:Protein phosphatase CheZ n=1 Tax=Candidatus Photodesmus katoptron Akat1 TaxID=1236703 RepID=S3DKQ6_9GAMM|nr:protein phosphatase CheZ [Candidatus Photodesmus katoptron]EPE37704.1 chemotaxis phosphatase, CheZ protein [Candidatus Photodesmus katoptron Akat1]KEY90574.1 chemotaxis phosphatase [Candidatus Photodesmus katoptron]
MISLEQAKQLVELLEQNQKEKADIFLKNIYENSEHVMLKHIGTLTRDLHDSLNHFSFDERIRKITDDKIPDARERLLYIIEKTEIAANKTMNAVDLCMPIAEKFYNDSIEILPKWNELMHGRIKLSEFKALCHKLDKLLFYVESNSSELKKQLNRILIAQDFQDLTGQIIRHVIALVNEVEKRLVDILTIFASNKNAQTLKLNKNKALKDSKDSIIKSDQQANILTSQDEVDDLLSSLGF